MANMTGAGNKVFVTPWTTDRRLEIGNETVSVTTSYYDGQAVGRDASGYMVQMDDTAKAEFLGFITNLIRPQVDTTDSAGDKIYRVEQPQMFTALIASAAAGDEGRSVYWLYNNQVQYTPTTYGNYAGKVWYVKDSTHVVVIPPWMNNYNSGGYKGFLTGAATGTTTLTKYDVNKVFAEPITGTVTINLPVSTTCSPGDHIEFIKTSSSAVSITLNIQGSDSINAATTTFSSATTQFAKTVAVTDGAGNWYAA